MRILVMMACMLLSSAAFADGCVTNLRGKTVCSNGEKAVAAKPNTGTLTTAQKQPGGVTTAQNGNGTKAAYNPHTGNSAVAKTNQNGVTTTQTARGSSAKTKNGMGAVETPNGTVCAKGRNNQGCTKP